MCKQVLTSMIENIYIYNYKQNPSLFYNFLFEYILTREDK